MPTGDRSAELLERIKHLEVRTKRWMGHNMRVWLFLLHSVRVHDSETEAPGPATDVQAEGDKLRAEGDELRKRLEVGEAVATTLRHDVHAAVNDPERSTVAGHAAEARKQAVHFLDNGGNEYRKTKIADVSDCDIVAWLADAGQKGKASLAVEFLRELTELTISGRPNEGLSPEACIALLVRACIPLYGHALACFMARAHLPLLPPPRPPRSSPCPCGAALGGRLDLAPNPMRVPPQERTRREQQVAMGLMHLLQVWRGHM